MGTGTMAESPPEKAPKLKTAAEAISKTAVKQARKKKGTETEAEAKEEGAKGGFGKAATAKGQGRL